MVGVLQTPPGPPFFELVEARKRAETKSVRAKGLPPLHGPLAAKRRPPETPNMYTAGGKPRGRERPRGASRVPRCRRGRPLTGGRKEAPTARGSLEEASSESRGCGERARGNRDTVLG
ncbi:hypothetical protein HPB50_016866 [Hyalomma asiaticum]|uniref:Uncharacterized protein n=1 Tax=Hyalomma asiaticum TaxID=266040 RepID=A0ACB7S3R4_HYAAI|nr:hypothetical protein HPB50_016866 [Hyalomma asiaticum]